MELFSIIMIFVILALAVASLVITSKNQKELNRFLKGNKDRIHKTRELKN